MVPPSCWTSTWDASDDDVTVLDARPDHEGAQGMSMEAFDKHLKVLTFITVAQAVMAFTGIG